MIFSQSKFISSYLPAFIGGLTILAIGVVLSIIVKQLLITLFRFFRVGKLLENAHVFKSHETKLWGEIVTQIVGWSIIILFMIPASEVWGLHKITDVLHEFLRYIPNVLVAVIISLIGYICASLASDVVRQSYTAVDKKTAPTLAAITKSAIMFFTILVVLDQLHVAQELVRILFTGIVAMISIAGGLAFGLGGKDLAKEILDNIRKKLV